MEGGYINEGGQLKSKNGQKYIVNETADGVFVSKFCAVLTLIIVLITILLTIVITYFLTASAHDTPTSCNNGKNLNHTNEQIATAGLFNGFSHSIKNGETKTDGSVSNSEDEDNFEGIEIKDIKLHEGWSPEAYTLLIEPNLTSSTNNGSVTIELIRDNKFPGLLPIVLDISDIKIENVRVKSSTTSTPIEFESGFGENNESYFIKIKSDLNPNTDHEINITISMDFISQLSNTLQGIYKTNYINAYSGKVESMISTQFSPIDARRAFPCLDRPDKKANFSISIVHEQEKMMALSNMPSVFQSFYRPGYIKEDFETTPKMPTYLVAFIVSNLVKSNISDTDEYMAPRIEVWTRPEVSKMAQFSYKLTRKLLPFYEKYFGIPYQLKKLDLVSIPDFGFGAMENWGLTTFRDSTLLVPRGDLASASSASNTESVAGTVAHELAHQWFGNLVTPKWWDDLWLKEGFATYMSSLAINSIYPEWKVLEAWSLSLFNSAMRQDSDKSSHAIVFPVQNTIDIRRIFDSISYSKGSVVIRMVNSFIGDEAFKTAIQNFLKSYSYSNANRDDLWNLMTAYGHKLGTLPKNINVKDIMDSWTKQAGYPVVNVSRIGSDLAIKQHRYMLPSANDNDNSKWIIPITYATNEKRPGDNIPSLWLSEKEAVITDVFSSPNNSDQYTYLNIDRMGYYRVNYDYPSWVALKINFKELPKLTRAQLLDDALHLARSNILLYDIPLTFLMEMRSSFDDLLLWSAADNGLDYLIFMLQREPAFELFRAFMRYIIVPAFDHYKLEEPESESHLDLMHRSLVAKLACKFNYDRCVNAAQLAYRKWMTDPINNVLKPNLKQTTYCTALQEGSFQEWYFAHKRYTESTSASEKEQILSAMGCTSKPWLLSKYLNMTIDPEAGIRKQDGARAFRAVAKNPIGYEIAFDFLVTNIKKISEYFGDGFSTLSSMIDSITVYMSKDYQLEQLQRFNEKTKKLGLKSIQRSIELATEKVKNNIEWRSRSYYNLSSFLQTIVKEFHINIY